jgi:hypothetical protein
MRKRDTNTVRLEPHRTLTAVLASLHLHTALAVRCGTRCMTPSIRLTSVPIEASRRGRQGRGTSRSWLRPLYGGQASHRPSYGDWTSRQPRLPDGPFADHVNRGFQGDLDEFYGPDA